MTSSILIVGTGSMGVAHMYAFKKSKDKQIIYLLDKKEKIKLIKKIYKFNIHKKIIYLTKIPKRKVFDFVIVSTDSKNRFNVTKNILKYNKIKFLLLEKFIFLKNVHYKIISEYIKKKKIKCYINSWGFFLAKKLSNQYYKNKKISVQVFCDPNNYLTNLIHYVLFFYKLKNDKEINFSEFIIKKKIKSKFKYYPNIAGFCKIISSDGSSMIVKTLEGDINKIIFIIYLFKKRINITINEKNKIILKNKKITKIYNFPLARNFTKKIHKFSKKNKINELIPNYDISENFSKKILTRIYQLDKKLNIR